MKRIAEGNGWTVSCLNGKHVLAILRTGQLIEQPCDCAREEAKVAKNAN